MNQMEDEAGPFPTPGIDATWVVSKRFYFDGRVQYLDLHFNQLDGSLGFFEFDALYRFRPNVSFALGYSEAKAHLVIDPNHLGRLFRFQLRRGRNFSSGLRSSANYS